MKRTSRTDERRHTAECLAHNVMVLETIFSTYGVLFGPLLPTPGQPQCHCAPLLEPVRTP